MAAASNDETTGVTEEADPAAADGAVAPEATAQAEDEVASEAEDEVKDATDEAEPEEAKAEAPEAEPEPEPEDPLAPLKKELADMEKKVSEARLRLSTVQDSADNAGQNGYLRLMAQVENYKRSSAEKTKGFNLEAKEETLREFMTLIAAFENAATNVETTTDGEAKIQDNYQAIYRALLEKFGKLGLEEFYAVVGEPFVPTAHDAVASEYSDVFAANQVMSESRVGYRLNTGAIVRKAAVVKSLGVEGAEAEPAADDAADADAAEAAEAADAPTADDAAEPQAGADADPQADTKA